MKALCLKQPYASWGADGFKTIETRTWRTNFRGRFLIVASLAVDLLLDLGFERVQQTDVWKLPSPPSEYFRIPSETYYFPRGVALATAQLVNCRPMTEDDEKAACCEWYDPAWAWLLADVRKIQPFPVKGQLGFFEVLYKEEPTIRSQESCMVL